MYLAKQLDEMSKGNVEEALKLSKRTVSITNEEKFMAIKMLDILGLEYCLSEGESDKVLAYLTSTIPNSYCYTADSDVLAHGSPNMLINGSKKGWFDYIGSAEMLTRLELSREQFTRLCVLLGTDYNPNIKGMGWKATTEKIRQYSNIKDICQQYPDGASEEFTVHLIQIEKVFNDNSDVGFEKIPSKEDVNYEMFKQEFESTHAFAEKRLINLRSSLDKISAYKSKMA